MIKKVGIILTIAVIVLQLFRGSEPRTEPVSINDLIVSENVSDEVAVILKEACYDCHSMQTEYPWYTYVTPVSWFVFDHVRHGRGELNFSDWASFDKESKLHILKDVGKEVSKNKMPLDSYVSMHSEANLTPEQRKLIEDWAQELAARISSN